jgi:toluene monooxygenase system protein E
MDGRRKTYWHLSAAKRMPSDYEIATSRLLYYVDRGGFAVDLPTSDFYARHQRSSPLASDRWEDFADPRATTYTKYVSLQRDRESYLGCLLGSIEESGYDGQLPDGWIDRLARLLSPLRFLFHGLQMVAAYVGQMAPSGRIAVAALFQCADEVRRLQRFAYRLAQLRRLRPDAAEEGRFLWQSDPGWQPLRRTLEKLLCTYDWGEALVVLNVCLKPVVDRLALSELAGLADRQGDYLDAQILRALFEDCEWHREWSQALLNLAIEDRPANRQVIGRWVDRWAPAIEEVAFATGEMLTAGGPPGPRPAFASGEGPRPRRSHG